MPNPAGEPRFLGLEGGGTRTTACWADRSLRQVETARFGPGNLRLLSDAALARLFAEVAARFPHPSGLGIGLAGARTEADRTRIRLAAQKAWGAVPLWIGHDLDIALAADAPPESQASSVRCLILSGTGSCCYALAPDGRAAKQGGWGHILGDKGSGFEIGLRGLKAIVYYYDRDGSWSDLGQRILTRLTLNHPEQLIDWVRQAEKHRVADLAIAVFESAARRDAIARDILEGAAHTLAKDALSCAAKLAGPDTPVRFVLAGSVLLRQPRFATQLSALLRERRPGSHVVALRQPSVYGAVRRAIESAAQSPLPLPPRSTKPSSPRSSPRSATIFVPPLSLEKSPTETRNPRSTHLDKLSSRDAVRLMLQEEQRSHPILLRQSDAIAEAVDLIAASLQRGGRLFYAGAGTSGRLGVLDASECPPTFRSDPNQVQAIIAGGEGAITRAVEGAEDDAAAGASAARFRGVSKGDVLVGIAASGRTPFVWGSLAEARKRGAKTILLCFNPHLEIPRTHRPDLLLAFDLGPELLTGSTRLKCGTATKILLNTFSTLAMVRLGKVVSNLMVDLSASNEKLRQRAVRILQRLSRLNEAEARALLEANGWRVKDAAACFTAKRSRAASSTPRDARKRSP